MENTQVIDVNNLVGNFDLFYSIDMTEIEKPIEWSEYEKNDNQNYCDKGGHRERSLHHSPQHARHWKKEAKKQEEAQRLYEAHLFRNLESSA